ncbi:MAG: MazG nucleotide pyrophosphohydrolase domain-containing protein [Candidatus Hodarchaeota archaeon]
MKISDFQDLMKELYIQRDKARGTEKTMLWFISEVGELSEAIRLNKLEKIAEEMADVLAWLCSIANLTKINLETAVLEKYPGLCSRCNSKPCECDS